MSLKSLKAAVSAKLDDLATHVKYYAENAGKIAAHALGATLVAEFSGSLGNFAHLPQVGDVEKVATAAVIAAAAAVGNYLYGLVKLPAPGTAVAIEPTLPPPALGLSPGATVPKPPLVTGTAAPEQTPVPTEAAPGDAVAVNPADVPVPDASPAPADPTASETPVETIQG